MAAVIDVNPLLSNRNVVPTWQNWLSYFVFYFNRFPASWALPPFDQVYYVLNQLFSLVCLGVFFPPIFLKAAAQIHESSKNTVFSQVLLL